MADPIRPDDRVADVIARDERVVDVFVSTSPAFERLRKPWMRKTMAKRVTRRHSRRAAAGGSPSRGPRTGTELVHVVIRHRSVGGPTP